MISDSVCWTTQDWRRTPGAPTSYKHRHSPEVLAALNSRGGPKWLREGSNWNSVKLGPTETCGGSGFSSKATTATTEKGLPTKPEYNRGSAVADTGPTKSETGDTVKSEIRFAKSGRLRGEKIGIPVNEEETVVDPSAPAAYLGMKRPKSPPKIKTTRTTMLRSEKIKESQQQDSAEKLKDLKSKSYGNVASKLRKKLDTDNGVDERSTTEGASTSVGEETDADGIWTTIPAIFTIINKGKSATDVDTQGEEGQSRSDQGPSLGKSTATDEKLASTATDEKSASTATDEKSGPSMDNDTSMSQVKEKSSWESILQSKPEALGRLTKALELYAKKNLNPSKPVKKDQHFGCKTEKENIILNKDGIAIHTTNSRNPYIAGPGGKKIESVAAQKKEYLIQRAASRSAASTDAGGVMMQSLLCAAAKEDFKEAVKLGVKEMFKKTKNTPRHNTLCVPFSDKKSSSSTACKQNSLADATTKKSNFTTVKGSSATSNATGAAVAEDLRIILEPGHTQKLKVPRIRKPEDGFVITKAAFSRVAGEVGIFSLGGQEMVDGIWKCVDTVDAEIFTLDTWKDWTEINPFWVAD